MSDTIQNYRSQLEEAIVQVDTIKIFDNLLTIWVEMWASDIHIEPFENYSRVRLRIDWVLQELIQYPKNIQETLIAKFKIESGQMRPDEKRLPQDARVSTTTLTNKEIDLRANTLPTVWWEKLVMRIVDKSKKVPPLDVMWIEWKNNDILYKAITVPNWIVLTTWPTWSGKSTTLYAALDYINQVDVNITTYEDPVENKADWLNQSQVRADIWYSFAQWLRAALRQDPDIIMVWEIRDEETLETAMEAAMTWHLVFSTIHANSAAETITRILNMWAQTYMIWWTFNLVMAQRLARTVCPHCKDEVNLKEEFPIYFRYAIETLQNIPKETLVSELKSRGISKEDFDKFAKEGIWYIWTWKDPKTWEKCSVCWWTWAKWRIWIYEFLEFTDDIKSLLMKWSTSFELENYALDNWMINLERDALFKTISWKISLDTVYKLTKHKEVN